MAQIEIILPKELQDMLDKAENHSEDCFKEACNAALDSVYDDIKSNVPVKTGDLKKSMKRYEAKIDKKGTYRAKFLFTGKDSKGALNALKAMVIEYGGVDSKKHPKKPFVRPIFDSHEGAMKEAIEKALEKYLHE